MPNELTRIRDIIVPEIFTQYVILRTMQLSNIIQSGLAIPNPLLNQLVTGGGTTINMPHWQDLKGRAQIMSDTRPLSTNKITTAKDVAVLLIRANAWQSHELAGALAGSDPFKAIGDLVADWWVREEQTTLINLLNGVFNSPSMQDLVHTMDTVPISAEVILDAKQLLGDAAGKLTAIAMHSAVFTELQKQNLIDYIPNSRGEVSIPTYLKYTVIVDDEMPYDGEVYTTYLFSRGVIGRGEGTPVSLTSTELDRDSLGSADILINRRAFVMHPMGVKWVGTSLLDSEDATPSDADMLIGSNWSRVYDKKHMGIVKVLHTI
jgi:hypothetical protein